MMNTDRKISATLLTAETPVLYIALLKVFWEWGRGAGRGHWGKKKACVTLYVIL